VGLSISGLLKVMLVICGRLCSFVVIFFFFCWLL